MLPGGRGACAGRDILSGSVGKRTACRLCDLGSIEHSVSPNTHTCLFISLFVFKGCFGAMDGKVKSVAAGRTSDKTWPARRAVPKVLGLTLLRRAY